MSDLMIKIENVSKEYRLGVIGGTTLKEELQRLGAKLQHKEDPTVKLGQERISAKGTFMALSGISFEARKGEAIGIIGHNGAGKSTLLKLITRITAPTEGTINLNGRVASMLEVGTGFHPELTGRENVYLNGAILGMSRREIDEKMDDIIDFSECRQFIDTPVKRYSSGMYVKLAFSVAAHLDSEIVIMDEVLAVGDVAFQNKCIKKMREIATAGHTVLYVSHNMSTIRSLCDRCIVLNKGMLQFDGDVENAISYYVESNFIIDGERDFSNTIRPYKTTQEAHIEYFRALDKTRCVYKVGDKMLFTLSWIAKRKFDRLQARLNIFSATRNGVGISFSKPFVGIPGYNETTFELDTSCLLQGKYRMEILFIEMAEDGMIERHDIIGRDDLSFEIIPNDNRPELLAALPSWGHFVLPDAKIVS